MTNIDLSGDGQVLAPLAETEAQDRVADRQRLFEIQDLRVSFKSESGPVQAVRGVDVVVHEGELLGIVGESGSGKSVTFLAAMGLLPKSATVTGSVRIRGQELLAQKRKEIQRSRGKRIAMIFQDPLSALNPTHRVGSQIVEMIDSHQQMTKDEAAKRAVELLDMVGIPQPATRARQYPHEFSGGMRQRVMIAMAIANDPEVLIADEPTTALDVTVQAQILEVIQRIQRELGTAVVFITHDLGVVARIADRVQVMYAGRAVERGRGATTSSPRPTHPYTKGLLASLPALGRERLTPDPRLAAEHARPAVGVRVPDRAARSPSTRAPARSPSCGRSASVETACIRAEELVDVLGGGDRDCDASNGHGEVPRPRGHRPRQGASRSASRPACACTRPWSRRCPACRSRSAAARRSAWWASRGRASPPSAAASSSSSSRAPAR